MKKLLLITPPFTQLNTAYPATAYLKGFLNTKNISSYQADLGIEVIVKLFSEQSFQELFEFAASHNRITSDNCERIYTLRNNYLQSIDSVIAFLQGKNQTFARQICTEGFLPQASRCEQIADVDWAFGSMGFQDKAKHLATLYLEDLSDFIVECIDPHFGFSRYAERLGQSANSFSELHDHLQQPPSYIDIITLDILDDKLSTIQPNLVCISVPFPGNLYSAFRCAQFIKNNYPSIKVAMGGGFPNTELRSVSDVRVFDFFDYITLDDGELPLELLTNSLLNSEKDSSEPKHLKRTFLRENNEVIYNNLSDREDYKQKDIGTPDYSDLLLDHYISIIEVTNPMHSLWSDGRWNKLTMAHGCYWRKCTFCDISLDYIRSYEPIAAKLLVDRVEEIIKQTGEKGFHFVDEAAPPSLMKAFAIEVIKRRISISWWTNIRFEKYFSGDICILLEASGCIAVSGGLEVASDRLLSLIDKGVTVKQVAQVTNNFTVANIMVHSYLMYGYPTQTVQETVDSLEMVRQLFELGIIQSGFWHQFALTAHSPIGLDPDKYGLEVEHQEITFANNDVQFEDKTGIDHSKFSYGLKKSLYNFMHGIGFDFPLQDWFDFKIPQTQVKPNKLERCLAADNLLAIKLSSKICWLGNEPLVSEFTETKKSKKKVLVQLIFHGKSEVVEIILEKNKALWLVVMLEKLSIHNDVMLSFEDIKRDFEKQFEEFNLFWYSEQMELLRKIGLIIL
ncbi:MAG: radical SAM protein [Gammaproteobacteria bacterium]|nr:MAG: radical SAM protein [Gammaproteobacteria bacterium]